jgi:hypothetical protein
LLTITELRAKAARLRKRARGLSEPRDAENLRAMADAYDLMARHRANNIHPWAPEVPQIG